jgi:hypothetical protein
MSRRGSRGKDRIPPSKGALTPLNPGAPAAVPPSYSNVDDRMVIEMATGARAASTLAGGRILGSQTVLYQMFPNTNSGATFTTQATSGVGAVNSLAPYWLQLFKELCALMVTDRLPISQTVNNVVQADIIGYMQDWGNCWGALNVLQAIENAPFLNTPLNAISSNVTGSETNIRQIKQGMLAMGIPPLFRAAIDIITGVYAPEPTGPVIIGAPQVGVYAAGTMADFGNGAELATYITNIKTTIDTINSTATRAAISGAFLSAYGVSPYYESQVNTDQRAYDMWLTRMWAFANSTGHTAFFTPTITQDAGALNRVPLLVRRDTWKDGDLTAELYSSLMRPGPVGVNNGAAYATSEQLGWFTDPMSDAQGTMVEWWPANSSTGTKVASTAAAASAGILLTDPIAWEFPWEPFSAFNSTTFTGLRPPMPDFETIEVSSSQLAENTWQLINKFFGTGYKGTKPEFQRPRY